MDLGALDDVLVDVRRLLQRPAYRQRLRTALGGAELGTVRVLRAVERAGEGPSVGDVAEILAVDPSTASRMVAGEVEAGLLTQSRCHSDRRRLRLALTEAGRDLLERATAVRRELLQEVTAEWPADDVDGLVVLLRRLRDDFGRLEQP